MKATCPNSKKHKRFITVAVVTEDWIVDQNGDFIEVAPGSETEVINTPHRDNVWTCAECGAKAKVS